MSLLVTFLLSLNFLPLNLIGHVDTSNIPDAVRARGERTTRVDDVRFNTNHLPDALGRRVNVDRRH